MENENRDELIIKQQREIEREVWFSESSKVANKSKLSLCFLDLRSNSSRLAAQRNQLIE